MYITSESLGLDNAHIYSPYLRTRHQLLYDYLLPDGEFVIHYNLDHQTGVTLFGLYREELKYVVTKNEVYEAQIDIDLLLPSDIPLEINQKYYFGNVEGVNTDDGVVVPDSQYKHYSNGIHLSFMGHNFEATHGWMMFTRLDEVSRDEDWTRNILDMRFGFVANSDEHTIIVEDGRIEDNPGDTYDYTAKPFINCIIGARYQDIIYCNCYVSDADEIAYMAMPQSEYDYYNQTTAEEVFERGTIVDLAPYKESIDDNSDPIRLNYFIDGLTPNTEYMIFIAALNKASGIYFLNFYSDIKTQAPDGQEYEVFLWGPHTEVVTKNSATITMILKYCDSLSYHICKGESCDCNAKEVTTKMIPIEFDTVKSFLNTVYPTIELEDLEPYTTYTVTIKAKNPMSTKISTVTFTTTDESNE